MAATFEAELDIIGFPRLTIAELKAYQLSQDANTRKDGSVVFVNETQKLYQWNSASAETPDDIDVVLSDHSATGRWLAIGEFAGNVVHKTGDETINGKKIFNEYTVFGEEVVVFDDVFSGRSGFKNGRFFARREDGGASTRVQADGKSQFPQGITDLPTPTLDSDAVPKGYVDSHPGTQSTLIESFVVAATPINTYPLPSTPTPDPNMVSFLTYDGVVYTAEAGDYSITEIAAVWTLTWLEPNGIKLETGESLILIYNASLSGGYLANLTANGIGLGARWNGTSWVSTDANFNDVCELDISDTANPRIIHKTATGNAVDTVITNFKINSAIDENNNNYPHYGTLKPSHELANFTRAVYGLVLTSDGLGTATLIMPKKAPASANEDNYLLDLFDTRDKITIVGATQTEYNVYASAITAIDKNYSATHFSIQYAITGTPATPATGTYTAKFSYHPKAWHNGHHFVLSSPEAENIYLTSDANIHVGFNQTFVANNIGLMPAFELDTGVRVRGNLWNSTTKGAPRTWEKTTPPYNIPQLHENDTIEIIYEGQNIVDAYQEWRIIGIVGQEKAVT